MEFLKVIKWHVVWDTDFNIFQPPVCLLQLSPIRWLRAPGRVDSTDLDTFPHIAWVAFRCSCSGFQWDASKFLRIMSEFWLKLVKFEENHWFEYVKPHGKLESCKLFFRFGWGTSENLYSDVVQWLMAHDLKLPSAISSIFVASSNFSSRNAMNPCPSILLCTRKAQLSADIWIDVGNFEILGILNVCLSHSFWEVDLLTPLSGPQRWTEGRRSKESFGPENIGRSKGLKNGPSLKI